MKFLKYFSIIAISQILPTFVFMVFFHQSKIKDLTLLQFSLFFLLAAISAKYFVSQTERFVNAINKMKEGIYKATTSLASNFHLIVQEMEENEKMTLRLSDVVADSNKDTPEVKVEKVQKIIAGAIEKPEASEEKHFDVEQVNQSLIDIQNNLKQVS